MKVKLEYRYEVGWDKPFNVYAKFEGKSLASIVGQSEISFDDAKEKLINQIKDRIEKAPTVIPEPEEIEIN